jgi:hypothetical protein
MKGEVNLKGEGNNNDDNTNLVVGERDLDRDRAIFVKKRNTTTLSSVL